MGFLKSKGWVFQGTFLIFFSLMTSIPCFSKAVNPPLDLNFKVQIQKSGEVVLTAPKGHHFNFEAPRSARLVVMESSDATKDRSDGPSWFLEIKNRPPRRSPFAKLREMHFALMMQRKEFPADFSAKRIQLEVKAFLCDDSKTYCLEKNALLLLSDLQKELLVKQLTDAEAPSKNLNVASEDLADSEKAQITSLQSALELAKKNSQPIIADFYGRWCAPCNLLDSEVFEKPVFKTAVKDFIFARIDVDDPTSFAAKSKYKIGGYPTVLFLNSKGEELKRVVGFLPAEEFIKSMDEIRRNETLSETLLLAQTQTDEATPEKYFAYEKLGDLAAARGEHKKALEFYENASPSWSGIMPKGGLKEGELLAFTNIKYEKIWRTKLALEEMKGVTPENVDALKLKQQILKFSTDDQLKLDALRILGRSLAEFNDAVVLIDKKLTKRDRSSTPAWELYELKADFQEKIFAISKNSEDKKAAQYSYRNAARALEKFPRSRGYVLELAYVLGEAGEVKKAEKIYNLFQKKFPQEFTFWFAHARLLEKLKRFPEALSHAEKAYEYSYGDNRLRSSLVLARTLASLNQKEKAVKLATDTLAAQEDPAKNGLEVRTSKYRSDLEEFVRQQQIL